MQAVTRIATCLLLWWLPIVRAEFNECLGVDLATLHRIPTCMVLAAACQAGVSKLNEQLHKTVNDELHPVSIVSATASDTAGRNATLYAMLVQLAPMMHCFGAAAPTEQAVAAHQCAFDMAKMEMYSILATRQGLDWNLDGYKHHSLSEQERQQIVTQYRRGTFFGSNLALGIFDTAGGPISSVRDATTTDVPPQHSILAPVLVIASATVIMGLLFHQRRRLSNGYAPIVVTKRGQVQRPTPRKKGTKGNHTPAGVASEEASLKNETNERFAV